MESTGTRVRILPDDIMRYKPSAQVHSSRATSRKAYKGASSGAHPPRSLKPQLSFMTTSTPYFTLDGQVRLPSSALLSVACICIRSLHSHYETRRRSCEAANDEDGEVNTTESLGDVEHTVRAIDPPFWQELLSRRLKPNGRSIMCRGQENRR